MKTQFLRIAGWFGIATPILSLTLVFVSVAMSPWFSWHANALSDMGVSATPNPFNFGLIAGGLLYIVFAIGLWKWISVDSSVATIGKVALMPCLLLSTLAWCASAVAVVLINHYILRIGY